MSPDNVCPSCGARVTGGAAGCQALFEDLTARAFAAIRYFSVHRLVVDAYALQHPGRYCRSAKSLAAHLAGLCCGIEHGGDPNVHKAIQSWLNGPSSLEKPERLGGPGAITVAHVLQASTVEAHREFVQAWAASVWEAWSEHHDLARRWVRMALGG